MYHTTARVCFATGALWLLFMHCCIRSNYCKHWAYYENCTGCSVCVVCCFSSVL